MHVAVNQLVSQSVVHFARITKKNNKIKIQTYLQNIPGGP